VNRAAAVSAGAATLLCAAAAELAGRSVARTSVLSAMRVDLPDAVVAVSAAAIAATAIVLVRRLGQVTAGSVALFVLGAGFSVGLWAQLSLGARLQSDGFYYFAYLRSLWFDGDVDLANDYRLLRLEDKTHLFTLTPTGHAQSAWSVGPALMAAPLFGVGHLVARTKSAAGSDVATDGTSYPYRQAWCVAGLVWGLIGLYFCFQLASRFASATGAALGTASVALGSFVVWYLVKEPSMAHAPSMAVVAAFCAFWARTRDARTGRQWVLLGMLGGFMVAVRWQNVWFLLLPAAEWTVALAGVVKGRDVRPLLPVARAALMFALSVLVGLLPQLLAWRAIYGEWFAVSPISPEIRWWDSHWRDVLWSARAGLFAWSPVLYVGAAGLVAMVKRDRLLAVTAWLILGLVTWLNGAVSDWWAGAAYGGRRFDSTLPLFAAGAAIAVDLGVKWVRAHPLTVVAAALAGAVMANLALMDLAVRRSVELEAPNAIDDLLAGQARTLHRWFGYPPSYPATLPFALRNRVTPADADILWATRYLTDPTRPYGRVDIGGNDGRAVGPGWHQPEQERGTSYRWASREAIVRVALDHAAHLSLQVRAKPFMAPGVSTQQLTLRVNRSFEAAVPIADPDWQTVVVDVPEEAWRAGINELRLTFSHATAPSAISGSTDRRELSAAIDFVRLSVVR
jgi:hypothetical protein